MTYREMTKNGGMHMSDGGDRETNIAKGCLSSLAFLIFIAIFVGSAFNNKSPSGSSDRSSVRWNEYAITIDVRQDGTIHVTEDQEVAFRGRFSQGYAEIPMERIESISNVAVQVQQGPEDVDENGMISSEEAARPRQMTVATEVPHGSSMGPGEYRAIEQSGEFRIDYGFEPTAQNRLRTKGETRRIVLEYDVSGVIRDYPDAAEPWQQLHWMAIANEVTEIADIDSATVTINLPEEVPADELAWAPEPDEVSGNQLVWHRSAMKEGDDFDVQVAFPSMTAAIAPSWQPAADARDAAIEDAGKRRSLASLLMIGAGVLVVVGGGLGLLYAWYTRIHETVPGLVPEILPEPPGDLPAALVGALVDEQVNPRDIAAAIMDLDHRGIIRIAPAEPGSGGHSQYAITLLQPIENALPYEQIILNNVFRREKTPPATASFDGLRGLFGAYRYEIQDAMNQALVERGFFRELPSLSRQKWRRALNVFLGASIVLAVVIVIVLRSWTWLAILPPLAGILVYLAGKRLTPSIARKTRKGAETSARWQAFERYLQQTGSSMFGEEWKTIKARYRPWVVAFGIDHQWLGRMNTPIASYRGAGASTSASPWWTGDSDRGGPSRSARSSGHGGTGGFGWTPSWSGWDASKWIDMQGTSDSILGSLGDASDSLFSMMGDAMEAIGKSSGSGGGGSSGSSFGGSSSSGGGRSHSSSGGGSRGFR